MRQPKVSRLSLYKARFGLLYLIFILLLLYLLLNQLSTVPPGLTGDEMQSAVLSSNFGNINQLADHIVNLPYHLLQAASLSLFGVSVIAIKLPSLILAFFTALGLIGILRRFFKIGATGITALLAVASAPFLVMGRTGSPAIMLSFLTVALIIAAAFILSLPKHRLAWKIVAAIAAVFLLYTPLGVYPLVAFLIAAVLHPHLRYHFSHTKWQEWLVLVVIALAAAIPLAIGGLKQPSVLLDLAGLPQYLPTWSQIAANLATVSDSLFNVTQPLFGAVPRPFLGLPILILIGLGILQLLRDSFSARTYVLIGWLVVFFIILSLNPNHILDLFIPAILILAVGIETLLHQWYKLFPRNPYARVGAVVPIFILITGISLSEISRYFDGYRYAFSYANDNYSLALEPIKHELSKLGPQPVLMIVPPTQTDFYSLLTHHRPDLTVSPDLPPSPPAGVTIVLNQAPYGIDQLQSIKSTPLNNHELLYSVYQVKS